MLMELAIAATVAYADVDHYRREPNCCPSRSMLMAKRCGHSARRSRNEDIGGIPSFGSFGGSASDRFISGGGSYGGYAPAGPMASGSGGSVGRAFDSAVGVSGPDSFVPPGSPPLAVPISNAGTGWAGILILALAAALAWKDRYAPRS